MSKTQKNKEVQKNKKAPSVTNKKDKNQKSQMKSNAKILSKTKKLEKSPLLKPNTNSKTVTQSKKKVSLPIAKTTKITATAKGGVKQAVISPKKATNSQVKSNLKKDNQPIATKSNKPLTKNSTKTIKKSLAQSNQKPVSKAPVKTSPKPVSKAPVKALPKPVSKTSPSSKIQPNKNISISKSKPVPPKPIAHTGTKKETPHIKTKIVEKPRKNKPNVEEKFVSLKKRKTHVSPHIKIHKIPKLSTNQSIPYEPKYKPIEERREETTLVPENRYSDIELQEFAQLIIKKIDIAQNELAQYQSFITRKEELGDDGESGRMLNTEDGSISYEREQIAELAFRQMKFIDALKKAMIRIENKTYGICRVTGKLISKERLKRVPHATLSIEAKNTMNV